MINIIIVTLLKLNILIIALYLITLGIILLIYRKQYALYFKELVLNLIFTTLIYIIMFYLINFWK